MNEKEREAESTGILAPVDKGIQELHARIKAVFRLLGRRDAEADSLTKRNAELQAKIDELEAKLPSIPPRFAEAVKTTADLIAEAEKIDKLNVELEAEITSLREWKRLFDEAPPGCHEQIRERMRQADALQPIIAPWKAKVAELERKVGQLTMEHESALRAVAEEVENRDAAKQLALNPATHCYQCDSVAHECGCNPNIHERADKAAMDQVREERKRS